MFRVSPHSSSGTSSATKYTRTDATAPVQIMALAGLGVTLQVKVIPQVWENMELGVLFRLSDWLVFDPDPSPEGGCFKKKKHPNPPFPRLWSIFLLVPELRLNVFF